MTVASIWALRSDPGEFYDFYRARLDSLRGAKPNRGHNALARMEEMGVLRCVITQNVDGLHQAAGSRRVVELHGNLRHARCVSCGRLYPIETVSEAPSIPRCDHCHDLVKPGVVLFGEPLPSGALEEAFQEARNCGLLLVIGSSLEVSPANMLPGTAKAAGARLAIANRTPTPADSMADYIFRDEAGEVLSRLLGFLGG